MTSQSDSERSSLADYLMSGPSLDGLDLARDATPMREVDLVDPDNSTQSVSGQPDAGAR